MLGNEKPELFGKAGFEEPEDGLVFGKAGFGEGVARVSGSAGLKDEPEALPGACKALLRSDASFERGRCELSKSRGALVARGNAGLLDVVDPVGLARLAAELALGAAATRGVESSLLRGAACVSGGATGDCAGAG
ncbi:MAG TPA: hypothetical protein VGM44_02580 [Polyangiaceae bacterium]|jgi:hypothetical protein